MAFMRRLFSAIGAACLICSFCVFASEASSSLSIRSVPLSVTDISRDAGVIFKGKLLAMKEEYDAKAKLDVRVMKFKVEDGIRGANSGETITLKEWSRFKTDFSANNVKEDKSYVFFFLKPSSLGLTTLIGQQGLVEFANGGLKFSTQKEQLDALETPSKARSIRSAVPQDYPALKDLCLEMEGK